MNAEAKGMGRRIGGMAAIGAGLLVIGGGYWMQTQAKLEAQEAQQVAASLLDQAVRAEAQATNTRQALEEQLQQCERENSPGPDTGATDGTDEKPQDDKPQDDKPQDDREEK
jgi:type II secretory pathway pseudopilin PulG